VELLDAVLEQAAAVEPTVNALTTIRRDAALAAAREAEARYRGRGGAEPRALEGLPVAVKEEQPIAGEPLELGSRLMDGYIADVTHPVLERIIAAGGVVHARTATPEFCSAAFTHTPLWGVTRNPWNTDCTPGGSSGGSGAALASATATRAAVAGRSWIVLALRRDPPGECAACAEAGAERQGTGRASCSAEGSRPVAAAQAVQSGHEARAVLTLMHKVVTAPGDGPATDANRAPVP
jgi:hypothetical protein